jgi:DNA-binding NtrC family response regulator
MLGRTVAVDDNIETQCSPQVLVIDQPNGPADVLMSTIGVLLDQCVAVTVVTDHAKALGALDAGCYDLVVLGTSAARLDGLTILPRVHARYPGTPVMVVGRTLDQAAQWGARRYGAREVVNLPRRAAELRAFAGRVARRYLL